MTPTSPRDGESVNIGGELCPIHGNKTYGSCYTCRRIRLQRNTDNSTHPPEKVAADEEWPATLPEQFEAYTGGGIRCEVVKLSDFIALKKDIASSVARVEELEAELIWARNEISMFGKSANLPVMLSRLSRILPSKLAKSKEVK